MSTLRYPHQSWLAAIALRLALQCQIAYSRDTQDFHRTRIGDGDTLSFCTAPKQCKRIKLAGVNAPERRQPYSQLFRRNLARLCQHADVKVEARKTDKYGRTIGRVTYDGLDVQREQLHAGLAWHYKDYASEQPQAEREGDAAAEAAARSAHSGLWAWPDQTLPW